MLGTRLRKTKLLPKGTKDDLRNRPRLFDVIAINDQIKFIGGGILFVIGLLEKGRLLLVQFTDLLGSLFLGNISKGNKSLDPELV